MQYDEQLRGGSNQFELSESYDMTKNASTLGDNPVMLKN